MNRLHNITAIALTGIVGFSAVSAPIVAAASETGKKNTTIALGAVALGLLLTQHNKLPGILAAGGAAYAYSQYNKDVRNRHQDERYGYNYNRNGWHQDNGGYRYSDNNSRSDYRRNNGNHNARNDNQDYRNNNDQYNNDRYSSGNHDNHDDNDDRGDR